MKSNEKLWRTTKQVMYESDAVNLSFSLDLQQIIDVVNIHFFPCVLSSKWWRSALKWLKSQIWEVWWKQFNSMLELYLLQVTFYLINASNKFQTACISSHLQHEIKENWSKTYDIHIFHWAYIIFLMKNKPLKGKCLKSESRKLSAFLPINSVLGKKNGQ